MGNFFTDTWESLTGKKYAQRGLKAQEQAAQQAQDATTQATQAAQAMLGEGKKAATQAYDYYGDKAFGEAGSIPGRVAPIYEGAFQNMRQLAGLGYDATAAQNRMGFEGARTALTGGYAGAGQTLGDYLSGAQDVVAEGRTLGEQALTGADYGGTLGAGTASAVQALQGFDPQASLALGTQAAQTALRGYDPQAALAAGTSAAEQALTGYDPQAALANTQAQMAGLYGQAGGAFNPYATAGQQALQGMAGMASDPLSDPLFQESVERAQAQAAEAMGAAGLTGSGARVLEETGVYNQMARDQIARADAARQQMAQMGYGAAGNMANLAAQQAGAVGDIGMQQAGYGVQQAGQLADLQARQAELGAGYGVQQAGQLADLEARQAELGTGYEAQKAGQMADLYSREAAQQAQLDAQQAANLANMYQASTGQELGVMGDVYGQMAANQTAQGQQLGDLALGQSQAQNAAYQNYINQMMQAGMSQAEAIANLEQQASQNLLNLYGQQMTGRAGIDTGMAQQMAANILGQGQNLASIYGQRGNAQAAAQAARSQGIGNLFGTVGKIGTAAAFGI